MSSLLRNPRLQSTTGSGLRNSTGTVNHSQQHHLNDLDSYGGLSSSSGGIPNSIGKVFVGGLSWDTTNEGIRAYFSKYGEVVDAVIMCDRASGRSRGFGFVTFTEEIAAEMVSLDTHVLDGRTIEAKRAVSREEMAIRGSKTKKVFVGGLAMTVGDEEFKNHFEKFGVVTDCQIMVERDSGRPRGFGFITFEEEDSVEKVLVLTHELGGKVVEVKKAEPKRSPAVLTASPPRNSVSSTPASPTTTATAVASKTAGASTGFFGPYLAPLLNQAYVEHLDRQIFQSLSQEKAGSRLAGAGYYGFGLGLGLGLGINVKDNPLAYYGAGGTGSNSPFAGGHGYLIPLETRARVGAEAGGSSGMGLGMSTPVGPIGSGKPQEPNYGYFADPNESESLRGLGEHHYQGFGGAVENSRNWGGYSTTGRFERDSFEKGSGGGGLGGGYGIPMP